MHGKKGITVCLFDDLETLKVFYTLGYLEEQVYIGNTFETKILIDALPKSTPYYVLALSQHAAHLYLANNSSAELKHELTTTDNLQPMLKELHIDELNTSVNTHPTAEGGGKGSHGFHGYGSLRDQRKVLIDGYFRKIDKKVLPILRKSKYPLILAGTSFLLPIYRKVSKYEFIDKKELHGNMDKVSDKKLLELLKPLIMTSTH